MTAVYCLYMRIMRTTKTQKLEFSNRVMWQLLDIAYVIPASVFLASWLADFLKAQYSIECKVLAIVSGAFLGIVLTIFKIKNFVDAENAKIKAKASSEISS
jgi:hypothetical protein